MIPEFPEFKNLELSDKEEIESIAKQFLPYSDFHFITIFCWDIDETTLISKLNNNLIIKQIDCLTCEQFFSFIGINAVPQTVREISNYLYQNKLPLTLRWVPEETVKCLDGIEATITEDRDYFDYIYNVSDLYKAVGREYYNYNRNISRFMRICPNTSTKLIDLKKDKVKTQIENIFQTWVENKINENKECEFSYELKALRKLLSSINEFTSITTLGIFEKDKMLAFSINDITNSEYASLLMGKANTKYVGIYQFLIKETINLYRSKKIEFMNLESDLGLESLKASKLNYNPAFFLKKYKIEIGN